MNTLSVILIILFMSLEPKSPLKNSRKLTRFTFKNLVLKLAGVLGVSVVCVALYCWNLLNSPMVLPQAPALVFIVPGMSLSRVSQHLASEGVIDSALVFSTYVRAIDKGGSIKAGEYQFRTDQNELDILGQLVSGDVVQHQFTFVEGWTFEQTLLELRRNQIIRHTLGETREDRKAWFSGVMDSLGYSGQYPEGLFYPETYYFTRGTTDVDLLRRAYLETQRVLQDEWELRASGLPYESPYEALIMASIVEKETGLASERKQIAGVFVRRLKKRMRLQTDPTVIYGLGNEYKGNLTRQHLRSFTPYNTYRINGLPPTPIANSSRAAIHAALHPAKGESLYFVAKGDGSHYFSDTLDEHQKAVRKYQWKRSSNYHSSPQ